MRGKRLTVDEVKALPIGTKVVVLRTGEMFCVEDLGESTEEVVSGMHGNKELRDELYARDDIMTDLEARDRGVEVEYYEYIEVSVTNETRGE